MGVCDDLLREKQIQPVGNSGTYIFPTQITGSELATLGITSDQIADGSITAVKIIAAAVDTTKGLSGGGAGGAITLVPDTTTVELDGGVSPAKKVRVVTGSLGLTQLAVDAKSYRMSAPIALIVAGATARNPILTVPTGKTFLITSIAMAYHALPADPNGTFTARVVNYDVSDAADEALTASFDIESAMSVKTAYNPPILSTAVATLGQHDMLWLETISLNEGGDGVTSGGLAGVVTVEYYEV